MSLKIVYINHYGLYGGAQRSLVELIRNFSKEEIIPFLITPPGKIEVALKQNNIDYSTTLGISKFDHTRIGYYRKWRWLILVRELLLLFPTIISITKNKKKIQEADIVHLNEITLLIPVVLLAFFFKKKIVVHARALMNADTQLLRTKLIERILNKYVNLIIAIDFNVKLSLPHHSNISVVHNGLSLDHTKDDKDERLIEKIKFLKKRKLRLGFAGVLDKNKGVFELIDAVRRCKDAKIDVDLLLLGSLPKMGKGFWRIIISKLLGNSKYHFSVEEYINNLNIQDYVHWLGSSHDIQSFYSNIDIICFPSYYDAPGRPVFEGALFKKPSILAVSNPQEDTFINDATGKQIIAGNSNSIFNAICFYYNYPNKVVEHGNNAFALAVKNFDAKKNAKYVLDLYKQML